MRLLLSLVPLALPLTAPLDDPRPLQVFVLAGQSNMEGQAVVDLNGEGYNGGRGTLVDLARDPAQAALVGLVRAPDGAWRRREDVWVRYTPEDEAPKLGPLEFGFTPYEGRHHFGPELAFGAVLGDALEAPVLLVKTAWAGRASTWISVRPRRAARSGPTTGA